MFRFRVWDLFWENVYVGMVESFCVAFEGDISDVMMVGIEIEEMTLQTIRWG